MNDRQQGARPGRVRAQPARPPEPINLDSRKRGMIIRLRRIEGQLRGIQSMLDEDTTCEAVAQQLAAARRALDRAFYEMIACSLEQELASARDLPSAKAAGTHVAKILAKYG